MNAAAALYCGVGGSSGGDGGGEHGLLLQEICLSSSLWTLRKSRKMVEMDMIGCSKHRCKYFSSLSALDFLLIASKLRKDLRLDK